MQRKKQATIRCERTETASYCSCRCGILLPTRTLFCCCRRLAGRLRLAANLLDTESLLHKNEGAFRSVRCEVFGEFCPFPRSRSSQASQWARRPGKSGAPAELFCESQATNAPIDRVCAIAHTRCCPLPDLPNDPLCRSQISLLHPAHILRCGERKERSPQHHNRSVYHLEEEQHISCRQFIAYFRAPESQNKSSIVAPTTNLHRHKIFGSKHSWSNRQ